MLSILGDRRHVPVQIRNFFPHGRDLPGALIIYFVLFFLPGLIGVGYSFTNWSSYATELKFVGLDNFRTIFSANENYTKIISNTLLFTFITTIVKNVLGLLLAILLTKSVRFLNLHRSIVFMPSVLSTLIIGMLFKSILDAKDGLLNTVLRGCGLGFLAQKWLVSIEFAFGSVVFVIMLFVGYFMIRLMTRNEVIE